MKRSKQICLVLSGAMAAWPLGCGPASSPPSQPPTPQFMPPPPAPPLAQSDFQTTDFIANGQNATNTFTNNHYVSRAGYYHAPFHGWYPYPYNYFSPGNGYYYGGNWNSTPHASVVNRSAPTTSAFSRARDLAAGRTFTTPNDDPTRSSSSSSGGGRGFIGSGSSSSRSSTTSSGNSSSTSRGGFGSSSSSSSS